MTKENANQNLSELVYFLETDLVEEIAKVGVLKNFKEGEVIIYPGDKIDKVPIILNGSVKVIRENEKGEEILLYYLESGDTCAMTLQCCMRKGASEIKAVVGEDTDLLFVPSENMEEWMIKFRSWREFVLGNYHTKLNELIETVDALAFKQLDERLVKYLTDKAKVSGSLELNITHQQIADDLNSSRVVISRLLKQLEQQEIITLFRNKLVLKSI